MSDPRFTKPKLALGREIALAFLISFFTFNLVLTHWYQYISPPTENELVKIAIREGRLKEQETPDDVQNVARSIIAFHAFLFILPFACI
jgi:hypothetical protein